VKTIERDPRLPQWLNDALNRWPLCLDEDSMMSIEAFAWDADGPYLCGDESLFMNGYFMCRLEGADIGGGVYVPAGAGYLVQWKWRGRYIRHCFWLGWKGNGRFTVTVRFQTPEESAAGVLGPNLGQASAFARGTA
jgi:hypothetical protein